MTSKLWDSEDICQPKLEILVIRNLSTEGLHTLVTDCQRTQFHFGSDYCFEATTGHTRFARVRSVAKPPFHVVVWPNNVMISISCTPFALK